MYKNKCTIYNKYLLFGAYRSNGKVEGTESSEATNKTKEAIQWYSAGVFAGGRFLTKNCQRTNRAKQLESGAPRLESTKVHTLLNKTLSMIMKYN